MQGWWKEGRRTKWRYEYPCLASHTNRGFCVRSETRVAYRIIEGEQLVGTVDGTVAGAVDQTVEETVDLTVDQSV